MVWFNVNKTLVASSNISGLEANAGFFRLLMMGIFDPYELRLCDKLLISQLINTVTLATIR